MLARSCIIDARSSDAPVPFEQLTEETILRVEERLAEADPAAEILLAIRCPSCACEWQTLFDIVPFFWTEISVQARRLLREVDLLARAYGWREADILAMTPLRRSLYLDMVR
jgi:hypothetical protein